MTPRTRTLATAALALALGCVGAPLAVAPLPPLEEPHAERAPAPRLDPSTVSVRLSAPEGLPELDVHGAAGPDGGGSVLVHLIAVGERILVDRAGAREEVRLRPVEGARLTVEGREYDGELVVRARAAGGLTVVNRVGIEEYVRGVVAGESVLWSATPAELEAQAICARSYALATLRARLESGFDATLWDDTRDQVYLGARTRAAGASGERIERALDDAVRATAGRVLGYRGRVLDARFHAACGGSTARFRDVFGEDSAAALLPAVACAPCAESGEERWSFTASRAELDALARELRLGTHLVELRPLVTDAAGRWVTVELRGDARKRSITGGELRHALGATRMASTRIDRAWPLPGEPLTGGLHLEGAGRGHGVGLCQVGSRELAKRGWSAVRILAHYYPGSRLGRLDARGHFLAPGDPDTLPRE